MRKANSFTISRIQSGWVSIPALSLIILVSTCTSNEIQPQVDCSTTNLAIQLVTKTNLDDCSADNGSIEVSASGGATPYQFRLGTGPFGSAALFSNLSAGSYNVTVKDANGCEKVLTGISLAAPNGPSVAASTVSHQTDCLSPNGSITANVSGGSTPYQFRLDNGAFGGSPTFSGLKAGTYTITIMDNGGCTAEIDEVVNSQTGVSYLTDIKPILETSCIKSGCHNGDNGANLNWSVFANVQARAAMIKLRTGNKTMPADIAPTGLPQNQIDLIACWVDEGAMNN